MYRVNKINKFLSIHNHDNINIQIFKVKNIHSIIKFSM